MRIPACNAVLGVAVLSLSFGHVAPLSAQAKISTTGRVYKSAPPPAAAASDDKVSAEPKSKIEAVNRQVADSGQSASAPPSPRADDELNLICMGGGSANKPSVGTLNAWNNSGGYGSATIVGQRSQGFADEVRIRLDDDDPRLRMPRSMLPPIRGGNDGWFKLKNVEYSEGEITASIAVNMFNNPKLRLDRYTGGISISGKAGDFTGQCQSFDPENVRRAF